MGTRQRMGSEEPGTSLQLGARFERAGGKSPYIRGMFGRIAGVYDLMNRLMTIGLDRRWRLFAARHIALAAGECALDIGTGTADLAIALCRVSAPGASVVGVDFTPEMLEQGQRKIDRLQLAACVELRLGNVERLEFADGTFDACCSAFVVRNLSDLRAGLGEMLRVVRPGGRMVCLEISHPPGAIFGALFRLYFDRMVPLLGRAVGYADDAYTYLPSSASVFPRASQLKATMEEAGWTDVHYTYLTGGVVAVHVATKGPQ